MGSSVGTEWWVSGESGWEMEDEDMRSQENIRAQEQQTGLGFSGDESEKGRLGIWELLNP